MSEVRTPKMELVTRLKKLDNQSDVDSKFIEFEGIASTQNKDRHGDVVPAELWTESVLSKFKENPIVLYMHDHKDIMGVITELTPTDKGLNVKGKLYKTHPQSEKVEDGVLKSLSISFITEQWDEDMLNGKRVWIAKDIELLEISVVTVPANGDSVFSVKKSLGDNYEAFKNKHSQKSTHMDFEKIKGWLNGKASKEEKEQVKSLVSEKVVETPEVVVETPEVEEVETVETPEAVVDNTPEAVEKSAELKELEQLRAEKAALEAKLAKKEAKPVSTEKDSDPNPSEMTEKKLSPMEKGWEIDAEALRNFKR